MALSHRRAAAAIRRETACTSGRKAVAMTDGRPDAGSRTAMCRGEGPLDVEAALLPGRSRRLGRRLAPLFLASARGRGIEAHAVPAGAIQDAWVRPFRLSSAGATTRWSSPGSRRSSTSTGAEAKRVRRHPARHRAARAAAISCSVTLCGVAGPGRGGLRDDREAGGGVPGPPGPRLIAPLGRNAAPCARGISRRGFDRDDEGESYV